jgi:glutathione S-transferase
MFDLYLSWNAVCAMKIVLAMAEKAQPYTVHHLNLANFDQHQAWYLALNPTGTVPTLVWNDHIITESTIINEFLDETYPRVALRPETALERARMRHWTKLADEIVHPSIRPLSFMKMVRPRASALSSEELQTLVERTPKQDIADLWHRAARAPYTAHELQEYLHKIETVLDRMEKALQTAPYLVGKTYTLADASLTPYLHRLIELDKIALWEGTRPAVAAWLQRMQARPSYQAMLDLKTRYAA